MTAARSSPGTSALSRVVEVLSALTKFVEVTVPSSGLTKGKVTLFLGYEGAQMVWVAQNSYEEAAFNELGGLIGLCRAVREHSEAALDHGPAQSSAQMSERINVIVRDYGLEKSSASETHDALIAVLGVAQAAPKLTLTDITIHNNGVAQSMAAQAAREPRLAERLTDVIMMLDTPDAYNREYIAAVCRSILSSSTDRGGK